MNNKETTSPLFILYGSATGNAETIACDLAAAYQKQLDDDAAANDDDDNNSNNKNATNECFFSSVTCFALDQFKKKQCLSIWEQEPSPITATEQQQQQQQQQVKHGIIIICSTTGNGDPPENASRFVRFLKRKTTSVTTFQHTAYAVLGLGDTNYDQFCQAAKSIDKRLQELGAQRAKPLACADEATGLEEVVEPWTATVVQDLIKACRRRGGQCRPPCDDGDDDNGDDGTTSSSKAVEAATVKNEITKNATTSTTTTRNQTSPTTTTTTKTTTTTLTTTAAATTTTTKKQHHDAMSKGVQTLRGLLQLNKNDDDNNNAVLLLPPVDPTDLPTVSASRSSCELIHDDNDNDENDHDDDVWHHHHPPHEEEHASFSTVSSSGIHYTHTRPFLSTILKARYLTQTSTIAAAAAAALSDAAATTTTMTDESMIKAQTVFEEYFPFHEKEDNNGKEKENSSSNNNYERNGKRVIEMTLALPDDDYAATLEYSPGDSLGLIVPNAAQDVQFVLQMFQTHHNILPHSKMIIDDADHPITVEQAVRAQFDLSSPLMTTTTSTRNNNTKRLLYSLSLVATNPQEQCALQWLASRQGEDLARIYIEEQRRTVVDLLREFPSTNSISIPGLLGMLPSIPPRYYSVSSSPLVTTIMRDGGSDGGKSLTVAFSVVDYMTPSLMVNGQECGLRRIHGVATNYLEILCSPLLMSTNNAAAAVTTTNPSTLLTQAQRPKLKIFPKPTVEFRMPNTLRTPLVLIGPGTGVAPFMGFLAHRRALMSARQSTAQKVVEGTWRGGYDLSEQELSVHHGKDSAGLNVGIDFRTQQGVGTVDLFFGCRHADHDWLYREEMQLLVQEGVLSKLHTAFSRDNSSTSDGSSKKVYVQDLMRQSADRLCDMILSQKANVFVCGDGNAMAKDVQAAVVDILSGALGGTEQAQMYLETMKKDKRFLLDIWG